MISQHYKTQRCERENFIKECLNGDGKVIDSFIVDKGHKNGDEIHCVTDNGIIIVYNKNNNRLVTKLITRSGQIKRLYKENGKDPPKYILRLAKQHEGLGYNSK